MQRWSITTAFPKVKRSGGRCCSIQENAAGERGRRRNTEVWFEQVKSRAAVGEVPDVWNRSVMGFLSAHRFTTVFRRDSATVGASGTLLMM